MRRRTFRITSSNELRGREDRDGLIRLPRSPRLKSPSQFEPGETVRMGRARVGRYRARVIEQTTNDVDTGGRERRLHWGFSTPVFRALIAAALRQSVGNGVSRHVVLAGE